MARNLKKLKDNTAYLSRMIDANIEGYRAIRDAGHEIIPKSDAEFEGAAYRKTCLRFFKLMCATSLGKLCRHTSAADWLCIYHCAAARSAEQRELLCAFFDIICHQSRIQ